MSTATLKWTLVGLVALHVPKAPLSAQVVNLAPAGIAQSSSTGFGGPADLANDANRDGIFGNASVFHSAGGTGPGEWWEVDLGAEFFIDRILIFPREDVQQASVRDFKLEIFDASDELVWSGEFLPETNTMDDPWGSSQMSGMRGERVRLTLDNPNFSELPAFLTFAEIEVWGSDAPLPVNIAPEATLSSAAPGFGAVIGNGVDGDLAANFFAYSDADGPMFHDEVSPGQGFYRLDFPADITVGEVQFYNRIVNNIGTTTSEYRLSVIDSAGNSVASQLVTAAPRDYDHILDFGGVIGRAILVEESNPDEFLAFSEIRVMAASAPDNGARFTSITLADPETGELALSAEIKPNTDYFFERSSALGAWTEISDDISTPTGEVDLMYTPRVGVLREFYRLREQGR
jgi:hypothetical protein